MNVPATKPIAITLGDPAGIGPEIIAKAFTTEPALTANCFVVGDLACVRRGAAAVAGAQPPLAVARIDSSAEAAEVPPRCIPVLQVGSAPAPLPAWGQVSEAAGRLAAEAVLWAARAALRGEVAAIVTAPLHKEALAAAGFDYPGHTELLQAEAAAHAGVPLERMPVRMMLANDELRTVLVSIHVALRQALDAVTPQNLRETLRITDAALAAMLGKKPRIAVAGLNPHAGEGGRFGREEIEVIAPAVAEARAAGLDVHGPFAPDTVFMRARRGEFDAVLAMYHDQGLIPVKYLGVEQGVNVTLGLPLVRTSPDHGTAFDIAGTGKADAASLVAAIRMARATTK
jgi:4-hydroxythreonine-4-phosphate dehydrogenase